MSGFTALFLDRARAARDRVVASLRDGRAAQQAVFTRAIEANRETVFGKANGFGEVRTLADYRRLVPIRPYEDYEPLIARVVAGERGVLTKANPVLFMLTTGTTGNPKAIPATRDYFQRSTENLLAYWACLVERYPEVLERDDTTVMLHMAPKPYTQWAARGVAMHNPTCLPAEIKGGFPFSRAPWFPPPGDLTDGERLYYLLRCAAESAVYGFACLHPSRLQAFMLLVEKEGARLIDELRQGTVGGRPGPAPNPGRADELAALLARGPLSARAIWPGLRFVSCWTGGSFRMYLPEIRERFGAEIFPQMSQSSEAGHITLPLADGPDDGPLTLHTNFYEFLPVADGLRAEGDPLGYEELEVGKTYEMILTTTSGLYRYACGDLFRVLDLFEGVPRVEFVGRSGVSDLTGEKITEEHINAAIQRATAACDLRATNATCCALWGRPPSYGFLFEAHGEWRPDAAAALAAALDRDLAAQNSRYALKRNFGDLGPASVTLLARGTFARYRAELIAGGAPATQLKDKLLHRDAVVHAKLLALSAAEAAC